MGADSLHTSKIDILTNGSIDDTYLIKAVNDHRKCNILHDRYDILLLLDGGNEMTYRKNKLEGKAGIYGVFEPSEVHTTEKIYQVGTYYVVSVGTSEMLKFGGENFNIDQPPHFHQRHLNNSMVLADLQSFIKAYALNIDSFEIQSKFAVLLNTLFMEAGEKKIQNKQNPRLFRQMIRGRDYLQANFLHDVSLETLSNICETSKFHMIRTFKNLFGIPPHQYLIQLRINFIKNCLKKGALSDLIYCFSDQSHFIKYFKLHTGVTPNQFIKTFSR